MGRVKAQLASLSQEEVARGVGPVGVANTAQQALEYIDELLAYINALLERIERLEADKAGLAANVEVLARACGNREREIAQLRRDVLGEGDA